MSEAAWSNRSVLKFADGSDPLERANATARRLLEAASAQGLAVPPIDPFALARLLGLGLTPRNDVADASLAEDQRDAGSREPGEAPLRDLLPTRTPLVIAYNPSRPRGRLRFSIAHEIAHALFSDAAETIRHRTRAGAVEGVHEGDLADAWELELLCNVVAAELLLPPEAVDGLLEIDTDIDFIMETRRRWDVSTEALLRRLVMASRRPRILVAASRPTDRDPQRLRVDYVAGAATTAGVMPNPVHRGQLLFPAGPFADCMAVGQTARGTITVDGTKWPSQAVGIPGYPGQLYPRVLGLVEPPAQRANPSIRHVQSDLLDFEAGSEPVVVAHVVNDAARAWGRRGVAAALAARYPHAARAFRAWTIADPGHLMLGNAHAVTQRDGTREVIIVSMVAQHGYGPGVVTRLRYDALHQALMTVAGIAGDARASVHVPRLGAGQAGGRWDVIENDLAETLAGKGIEVIVHTLPAAPLPGRART